MGAHFKNFQTVEYLKQININGTPISSHNIGSIQLISMLINELNK